MSLDIFHRTLKETPVYPNIVSSVGSWGSFLLELWMDEMFLSWVSAANHSIWAGFQGRWLHLFPQLHSTPVEGHLNLGTIWSCSWTILCMGGEPLWSIWPGILESGHIAVEWGELGFQNPEGHQKESQINLQNPHKAYWMHSTSIKLPPALSTPNTAGKKLSYYTAVIETQTKYLGTWAHSYPVSGVGSPKF